MLRQKLHAILSAHNLTIEQFVSAVGYRSNITQFFRGERQLSKRAKSRIHLFFTKQGWHEDAEAILK